MRFSTRAPVLLAIVALLALLPARAGASERLVLDRVLAEPSWFEGRARLRLFVTPTSLEGRLLPVTGAGTFELRAGSRTIEAPYLEGRFSGAGVELAVAIVVEVAFDYRRDLPAIVRALGELVRGLPRSAQVGVVSYGGEIDGGHRLRSVQRARADLGGLLAELAPEEPELIKASSRALGALARAKPDGAAPLRKILIVVSDGRDVDPRPERYRTLARRARREGVRIHTVAYSPVDNRRALLGLGELSEKSRGTFRWVRDANGLPSHARNLLEEIRGQVVLTYLVPASEVVGERLRVARGELTSNPVRLEELSCGGDTCAEGHYCAAGRCVARNTDEGPGVLGWIVRLAAGALALFAVLLAVGFVLTKRQEARAAAPAPAPAPGAAPAPAASPAPAPGAAAAVLFVVAGPRQGARIPLRHGFTIGKGKRCDLVVRGDAGVSDVHAQFAVDAAGGYAVTDLGSHTGTFVNGVRATQMRLSHGMSIRVGSAEVRFLAHGGGPT